MNHNQTNVCGNIKYFNDFSDMYNNGFKVKHKLKLVSNCFYTYSSIIYKI